MRDINKELDDVYIEFSKETTELGELEMRAAELRRSIEDKSAALMSSEGDGSHGVEISAHAFKQISERLELLAMDNDIIYRDFINIENPSSSKSIPTNLKSFIITLIAQAKKKGNFTKEASKNTPGNFEYRYNIAINKWSDSKRTLIFTCIVENNNVKTGYFNW